ncbi:MAG: DegT/DnrJ/EryC1/StrS family aminotransferase, partial [Nitrospirae bacterium]|nr:DegT/DnrJ/EryC1/StrS family aminotransferase [Nitrospirota bacterium]
ERRHFSGGEVAGKFAGKFDGDRDGKPGGKFKVGACSHSHMAVFSFHPVKAITTGEGGAVLTNDEEYYDKLKAFRQHGIIRPPDNSHGEWYYEMQMLGYNYIMTDFQAALGISQLKRLDGFIARRREIVKRYNEAFDEYNPYFDVPVTRAYVSSAWHLYPIRLKDACLQIKSEIFSRLRTQGVGVQVHYIPVYRHPYYRSLGYKDGLCPVSEDFYRREISFPLYPAMGDGDVERVIEGVTQVFESLHAV